jgi:hypothetical protein
MDRGKVEGERRRRKKHSRTTGGKCVLFTENFRPTGEILRDVTVRLFSIPLTQLIFGDFQLI